MVFSLVFLQFSLAWLGLDQSSSVWISLVKFSVVCFGSVPFCYVMKLKLCCIISTWFTWCYITLMHLTLCEMSNNLYNIKSQQFLLYFLINLASIMSKHLHEVCEKKLWTAGCYTETWMTADFVKFVTKKN